MKLNYYAQKEVVLNGVSYSDRLIKENKTDLDDGQALDVIRRLQPKTYTYKLKPDTGVVYGFIAQEVKEVLPYAVKEGRGCIPFESNAFIGATISSNVVSLASPCDVLEVGKDFEFKFVNGGGLIDFEIKEIIDDTHFKADTTGKEETVEGHELLLVGKMAEDKHTLDKDAIFVVATAVLQELEC